jgi:hypothetical protein
MSIYILLEAMEAGRESLRTGDELALQEIRNCANAFYGADGAPEIRRLARDLSRISGVSVSTILTQSVTEFAEHLEGLAVIA